ncbi:DMT family transporter [Roseovarius sp. M141]|uniref:DMT family transporter n=1 Tax=Roseovarius sp. M141 TaxID=2583806 RepID=UPI0020CE2EBA|nr:DMT family transporter [Roseovarius sp. M141]MCQ0094082.1 DMT family transporter [Roseovarius sp. M141]
MSAWILLAIAAAAFQTLRFVLQKRLSMGALSTGGATFARFAYSLPFVVPLAALYLWWAGVALPTLTPLFWAYALAGGLAQILATWCMVALFAARNFAVGITFKKTETVQTALIGLIVLGDRISWAGFAAILIGLAGVLILSGGVGAARWRLLNRAAALGLIAGALFAVSAVGYRGATLEVASDDALLRALVALAVVTTSQAVGMALWLRWREAGEIGRVIAARRTAVWMGLTGLGGSLCWFTAFTLQNAAYVFAVGQVEVIFSLIAAKLVFGETATRREFGGIALVTVSVILVGLLR